MGSGLISLAYLFVSGDRKLFCSRKHKAPRHRVDDSMQKSKVEKKKKKTLII